MMIVVGALCEREERINEAQPFKSSNAIHRAESPNVNLVLSQH